MNPLPIVWRSAFFDESPMGGDSRFIIRGLNESGYELVICHVRTGNNSKSIENSELELFNKIQCADFDTPYIFINEIPPPYHLIDRNAAFNVLRFLGSENNIDEKMAAIFNKYDEIWIDTSLEPEEMAKAGVEVGKIKILPIVGNVEENKLQIIELAGKLISDLSNRFKSGQARPSSIGGENKINVVIQGLCFQMDSLSHVNRELARAMIRSGDAFVTMLSLELNPNENLYTRHDDLAARTRYFCPAGCDIFIRHFWPIDFSRPPAGKWIAIQPWEFGSIPARWVEAFNNETDAVWVPTSFVRQCYADCGVDASNVHVVPNGVDTTIFKIDGPMAILPKDKFVFLFVGGSIERKGIDILLKAWKRCFCRTDNVVLVIKDVGGSTSYKSNNYFGEILRMKEDSDAAQIIYINRDLTAEEMASLYRASDVLVHPYRGEGFGLPIAEAFACGLPAIITAGGATEDFCRDDYSFKIRSKKVEIKYTEPTVKPCWWLEPDFDEFCRLMTFVVGQKDVLLKMGRLASENIQKNFTWEKAARIAIEKMRKMLV